MTKDSRAGFPGTNRAGAKFASSKVRAAPTVICPVPDDPQPAISTRRGTRAAARLTHALEHSPLARLIE